MARVEILKPREQEAHFGLYRTSPDGEETIFVRRKVGDPTDYMHTKSRKLARQRANFALATQHYAQLTPSQKAITRHQHEEVEYIKSHGKTDTKLLSGRQLFISKEMHSLETTQKQTVLPYELCIMLVDENLSPLAGELWLYCTVSGEWFHLPKDEIYTGNWLFSLVPRDYPPYRLYGEALGYFDPMLPEHQDMPVDDLRAYHYHKLLLPVSGETIYPNGDGDLTELLASDTVHWQMVRHLDTNFIPPNGGGSFGRFEGNYVYNKWYPSAEKADLFTFTDPLYAAQYIYKLTAYAWVNRNYYPYGDWRLILKTHGNIYYSDYMGSQLRPEYTPFEFTTNPYTNETWTLDEVKALQLGVSLKITTMWTVWMCDHIYIDLAYS